MSDYISKSAVIDIVNKEIERVTNSYDHNTQLRILFAIKDLPIVDEKEIIHKTVDMIVGMFEEMKPDVECFEDEEDYLYAIKRHNNYIKVVKEVGGLYDSTRSKNNC